MLSLSRCRRLLGPGCQLSDVEVEQLRDELVGLARVIVGTLSPSGHRYGDVGPGNQDGLILDVAHWPVEDRESLEERAAILEFDGGASRKSAERTAFALYRGLRLD